MLPRRASTPDETHDVIQAEDLLAGQAPTGTGRAQSGRNVSRRGLEKALTNAQLPKMRFHDLRHAHCSLLVSEGLNVVYVSRSMGHASPDITLKTYSHLWDAAEHAGRASAALDAVYASPS